MMQHEKEKSVQSLLERYSDKGNYVSVILRERYSWTRAIVSGGNPPPFEAEVQPSGVCDANCYHCFGRSCGRLPDNLYEAKNMTRVIDQALGFRSNGFGVEVIKFCGTTGEPLVNPQTLRAIEMTHGRCFLRLFTNGLALAKNKNDRGYLAQIARVNRINVSLDAACSATLHKIKPGSVRIGFNDILSAFKKIKEIGGDRTEIEASFVITSQNYAETEKFAAEMKRCGAVRAVRYRIDMTDRTVSREHGLEVLGQLEKARRYEDENFRIYALHSGDEVLEANQDSFDPRRSSAKCYISRFWACIGPDGNVYPCGHCTMAGMESYGNLLEQDFAEIWNGPRRRALLDRLPAPQCFFCSPFSAVVNPLMTQLVELPVQALDRLHDDYIGRVA
jgi:radical SAM protein with 4Fe4S-binding SPASM domain